jgi:hypothetical protein
LEKEESFNTKPSAKIVWIGGKPLSESFTKSKKGNSWEMMKLIFHDKRATMEISLEKDKAELLVTKLETLSVSQSKNQTYAQLKTDFEIGFEDFELFWF